LTPNRSASISFSKPRTIISLIRTPLPLVVVGARKDITIVYLARPVDSAVDPELR
jgi:hypothetical protein